MESNNQKNKFHFDAISDRYEKAAESWTCIYRQIEAFVNPLLPDKIVLDIGNGGYFPYDVDLALRVSVLDISPVGTVPDASPDHSMLH